MNLSALHTVYETRDDHFLMFANHVVNDANAEVKAAMPKNK